ncbi:MAG TPA: DUF4105 domain-containing protein [Steroidobacteraceae bacterium]
MTATAIFCVFLLAIWGSFALWFQVPHGFLLQSLVVGLWILFSLAIVVALWRGRLAGGATSFAVAFAGLFFWWWQIQPSNQREWADDVAQMTTGVVDGDHVTLHNVRNFDWRTNTDYVQRWETRTYDMRGLDSVDMVLSYWSMSAIAHVLISFGFNDGEHVVFSVEVRREKTESFSEIGGFFKEFELSVIASDERDVIRVRTNVRGEDDYLYRIRLPVPAIRSLFLAYVNQANEVARTPRFYNTITANCTTIIYHMAKRIVGHLPLDYRLLLSGYLPSYVYKIGGLDSRFSLEELRARGRITERARKSDRSDTFSADIREGIP